MKFSIITPSWRSSAWLRLCVASVADQGVELEHIVQDSCSDDGTLAWLLDDSRVKAFVEKDAGMYDAINRGLKRSSGEICAYLNCDEQYLPGALASVERYFLSNSQVDVLVADTLIVDEEGNYLCHRKDLPPTRLHTLVSHNLAFYTSSTFFRRRVFEKENLFFDPTLKGVGDAEWALRLLAGKIKFGVSPFFASAFTETGANLNMHPQVLREKERMLASAPRWARMFRGAIIAHYRLRKLIAGGYHQKPFSYSLYTLKQPDTRTHFTVQKPRGRFRR